MGLVRSPGICGIAAGGAGDEVVLSSSQEPADVIAATDAQTPSSAAGSVTGRSCERTVLPASNAEGTRRDSDWFGADININARVRLTSAYLMSGSTQELLPGGPFL